MIGDVILLHNELISIGLSISGCSSDGTVHISQRPTCPEGEELTWVDPTDTLVALVLAAHEKALSSDECLALEAELTPEQWLAYTDARKAPIRALRNARYKEETDPMLLSALESAMKTATASNGEIIVALPEASANEWLAAKNTVRESLPYRE